MARKKQTTQAVIGYCRVSTEDQAGNGVSLDAQRHRIEAYCTAHGLVLARVEQDAGISAKRTTNRPGLQRALSALRDGDADGLVVVKLDRLSRTTSDILDLVARAEKEKWALHSIEERLDTESPHGRFVVLRAEIPASSSMRTSWRPCASAYACSRWRWAARETPFSVWSSVLTRQ